MLGFAIHTALATLLWFQTRRVRCVFEEDGLEFYNIVPHATDTNAVFDLADPSCQSTLKPKPSNFVTKTKNKWCYESISGYQFVPSRELPLICYYQETQTPQAYNIPGEQPHFAPVLFSAKAFEQEMEQRGVKYGFGHGNDEN